MQKIKNLLHKNHTAAAPATTGSTFGTAAPVSTFGAVPLASGFREVKEGDTVMRTVEPVLGGSSTFIQPAALSTGTVLSQSTFQKQVVAPIVTHREAPAVIHERIRREEVEEIQPVIHREREKTEIHKITQPIQTSSILPTISEERVLPAETRAEIRTPGMMPPAIPLGTKEEVFAQKLRVEKPALIVETEKRNIIEEVQPVVYKEVVAPHVIKLTQPIYERIVEGEVYVNQVLPTQVQTFTQVQPMTTSLASASTYTSTLPAQGLASPQYGFANQGLASPALGGYGAQQGFYNQGYAQTYPSTFGQGLLNKTGATLNQGIHSVSNAVLPKTAPTATGLAGNATIPRI